MREIKFRAWAKEEHEMIQANTLAFEEYAPLGCLLNDGDDLIIMQYTGLKDKNGKEIYEGDIVVITCYSYEQIESESIGEIVYSEALACFALSYGENGFATLSDLQGPYSTEYEVIGNIYENPELLQ